MKNLLNRLARIGLMLLLLVDRTPSLGVIVSAHDDHDHDHDTRENTVYDLHFDTDGFFNSGIGLGNYEFHFYDQEESSWFTNWNLAEGADATALAVAYGITAQITDPNKVFTGFTVAVIDYKKGDGKTDDIDGRNDLNFIGIRANYITNRKPVTTGETNTLAEGGSFSGTMDATDPDGHALTWEVVNGVDDGTLVFDSTTGNFTYTHDGSETNNDEFEFKVKDSYNLESNKSKVKFKITSVNDAPVAQDNAYEVDEDSSLGSSSSRNILGNDTDAESDRDDLEAVLVMGPTNGTLTLNANGRFTYTPTANFFGTDTFTYQAKDPQGALSNIATVTIKVKPKNDAPIAFKDEYTTAEDTLLTVPAPGVLQNDKDVDLNILTAVLVSGTAHGSITFNTDGSFTYLPNANYVGPDLFTYKVNDGTVDSNIVQVTINVTEVNDRPVANDGSNTVAEGGSVSGTAVATDNDSSTLTFSIVGGGSTTNGSVTIDAATGAYTYTHNGSETSSDSFEFSVSDGNTSDIGLITITVTAVNDAPVAVEDAYTLVEDTTLTTTLLDGVLLNDSDADSSVLTATLVTNVTKGTLTLNADGTFIYTPASNYYGSDFFEYKVSDGLLESNTVRVNLTITNANDGPVAQDGAFTVDEGETHLGNVLGSDIDSSTLTYAVVGTGATTNGTVVVNSDGSFTYTHNGSETITDSFEFTVSDGTATDTGLVVITVTPKNDAPVAVDDAYNTNEDTIITVVAALGVLSNDTDAEGDSLTATKLTNPTNGTLIYFNANGSFRYRPNANFHGTDSFTYKATDSSGAFTTATVTITVASINDKPIARMNSFIINEDETLLFTVSDLLSNDSDADNDSLTITNFTQPASGTLTLVGNQFTYIPVPNDFGILSFSYTISDGNGGEDSALVMITIRPINDAPIAVDDVYTTDEDQVLTISTYATGILANDTDVDSLLHMATLLPGGEPTKGTVSINLNGTFTYTPNANATGVDTFIYKVSDMLGASDLGLVTININPVNDAPVAVADTYTTAEDTALVVTLPGILGNDSDVDGDTITAVLVSDVSNGTLTLNADGSFTYTPAANFVGTDSFSYKVNDSLLDSNTVTVEIDVTAVNDAPVANPLAFTVANAGVNTGTLTATDVDLPANTLTFSLLTAPTNGTVTVGPSGTYTYTHNGSATLSDSFVFSVSDGTVSSTATVTITVLAAPTPPPVVNLAPVANPLTFTIANGALSTGTLTGSDPEGASLTFTLVSGPVNGTLVLSPAGAYTYDHNGTATTSDSFVFSVSDGSLSANATVTITILPIPAPANTAPVVVNTSLTTSFETPISGTVTGSDADGDPLSFSLEEGPTNGTIVFNPDGTFTYTPNDGFNGSDSFSFTANDGTDDSNVGTFTINVSEEEIVEVTPEETPLAALPFDWFSWLAAALAGLLAWLLAFLRPNMKYTLTDGANNQKVIRRRLSKPDEKTMLVELNDKDMVNLQTINVELYKRLAKHCGNVTVNFQLNGKIVHSVTIPEGIDDSFETLIRL